MKIIKPLRTVARMDFTGSIPRVNYETTDMHGADMVLKNESGTDYFGYWDILINLLTQIKYMGQRDSGGSITLHNHTHYNHAQNILLTELRHQIQIGTAGGKHNSLPPQIMARLKGILSAETGEVNQSNLERIIDDLQAQKKKMNFPLSERSERLIQHLKNKEFSVKAS